MSTASPTSQALVDIILPASPAAIEDTYLVVLLACLATLLIVVFIGWHQHYTRARHRRQLARVSRSFNSTTLTTRELAYQVAQILCDGLGIQGISSATRLPAGLQHQQDIWERFASKLDSYRYAPGDPAQEGVLELITESSYWLRHWR